MASALVAPLCAAGVGCQRVAATGKREFILLSWDTEISLGRETAPEFEKELGGRLDSLAIQAYVRTVGERVARSTHNPDLPYRFVALDSDVVNAFALPGGPVYVTRGLLEHLTTEGQLAALLGHELAHVNARHTAQQISRRVGTQVLLTVATAAAGRGEEAAETARYAQDVAKVIGGLVHLKYTRDMEREADRLGLDYVAAAGYDPQQMAHLLKIFMSMKSARALEFFSTHPNPENRVGTIQQLISQKYPGRRGRVAEEEYRRQVLSRLKAGKARPQDSS